MKNCCRTVFASIFQYETEKIVQINSVKVGIINRFIQLLIISYVVGWVMVYKKGYQETDAVVSGVVTKVKGVSLTNRSGVGVRLWDVADYVNPPQERDAVFVTTNAIITMGQTQGKCPEDPTVPGATCNSHSDCAKLEPLMLGNGVKTGRCVPTVTPDQRQMPTNTCEIYAWCPLENDHQVESQQPLLTNVEDFTLMVKNSVEFPKFKKKRTNIPQNMSNSSLSACVYDPMTNRYCPIFKMATILRLADTSFNQIALQGGIIAMTINWNCNFDLPESECNPEYSFRRLDEKDSKLAKGWNFRYANYYSMNGTEFRDVFKVFGIRILIFVTGEAGKFSLLPFTMNLGSGVALLGVATILCDMVVLYCLSRRVIYRDAKFQTVYGEDAFERLQETEEDAKPATPRQSMTDSVLNTNKDNP